MKKAKRMNAFSASIFAELAAYRQQRRHLHDEWIDLSVGSPDLPPAPFVRGAIARYAEEPNAYGYTLKGIREFHEAVADYYRTAHGVVLNPETEVTYVIGSQDGLVHLPMVFADPGDVILVPDPGYPAYAAGVAMAEAAPYFMPLKEENGFLPDLHAIPEEIAKRAAIMFLNFPGNPVPAVATESFYREVVEFAKRYDVLVVSDFAYGELYYDGNKPVSFLSVPGAKDVGVEINSLSKSYHMAGCRIGYLCGNADVIRAFAEFKSNLDYGIFWPIQKAAAEALRYGADFCAESRAIYQARRDAFINGLAEIGWEVDRPQAGMFVWAKVPDGWTSLSFTKALIDRAGVVVTPGHAFGPSGEGYVRIALVEPEEKLRRAVEKLRASGLFERLAADRR
ncbi:LL-diaminopimelate aminotransferase [Geobacillus sp. 46C-IIa]|uniref:LL-diaminopimelate aminotransferase n=1 Tax=Geobacillus sp. 46C-IIa TaxID=1963025 RepID=UPI0009BCF7AE|nr:LL-diaminopimelate aminotransferase [Geobacillus sp. 46C-IIa]OQP07107.1 LL-diaminopimelate aminotransferase [Geobacillus sp. 46C-IIa]QNU29434.1 LL-diaminopimelate aminotransferase [Geobacillus sp. 46C-IIa]